MMADSEAYTTETEEARGLIRAGRAAVRVGDYEAARIAFEGAARLSPESVEARDGLRDAQRRLGMSHSSAVEQVEYCYRHPDVETALHCTSCGRPICVRCSTPAAVGQLCPECRRGRRAPNYQVAPSNILVGGLVGLVVSAIAAFLVSLIGFGFFTFIILAAVGPAAAELIVRAVDRVTRNKRGRPMQITIAVAMILGGLLVWFFGFGNPLSIGLFLLIGVSTAVARLR